MATLSSAGLLAGLAFLLFGWVLAGGMVALSVPLEVRRARCLLNELNMRLGSLAG